MRATMGNMTRQIKDYFSRMSKKSRIRLIILTVAIVVFAIVVVSLLNRTNYALLTLAPSDSEAGVILMALQDRGVPAKVEGTKVYVPDDRVEELRVVLSAQGYFTNETDYSMLEQTMGFSVTDDTRQKLFEAQKSKEIETLILASDKVHRCYVNVNFGKTSAFAVKGTGTEPTASVMLALKNGATLSNQEAQRIADIVKTSVPDLKYENIHITDTKLTKFEIGDSANADPGTEINERIALESLLAQQIQSQGEQLLVPIFGVNNVKIQPHVKLNFDKVNTETIEFAPPVSGELDGVARSSSELYEIQRMPKAAEGPPGTDTNGMGPTEYPYTSLEDGDEYRKTLIEKNYEINQTITTIEKERGQIEQLSIAVIINSDAVKEDYTDDVTGIVTKAFGCAPASLTVSRLPFAYRDKTPDELSAELDKELKQTKLKELLKTIIIWAVILILGLAFISLIKSLVKSSREPEPAPNPVLAGGGMVDYMAGGNPMGAMGPGGPGGQGLEPEEEEAEEEEEDEDEAAADGDGDAEDAVDEIELNTKSPGMEQIERFIDKDPAAVAQLLRNWLSDEEE